MLEKGVPNMSLDTKGSLVVFSIPLKSGSFSAFSNLLFTSSAVTVLLTIAVMSEMEPHKVGTLNAIPSNLLFRVAITLVAAMAAPVVVGIILDAPARPRLRSLLGPSTMFCVEVYECTVVINDFSIPKLVSKTCITGEIQFVVQEPFDRISAKFPF